MLNFLPVVIGVLAMFLVAAPVAAQALPNDALTPGLIADADSAVVCPRSYAPSHRLDRDAYYRLIHEVLRAYGVPFEARHEYEMDHRVPLCLGGANDVRNVWPQPIAEAGEKDELERAACIAACRDHSISLNDAQRLFLAPADWRQAGKALSGRP